jgi:folate-dependent phosphoribosylglycinamide formyltransferase PurN
MEFNIAYITSAKELYSEGVGRIFSFNQDSLGSLQLLEQQLKNNNFSFSFKVSLIILEESKEQVPKEILNRFLSSNIKIEFVDSSTWAKPKKYWEDIAGENWREAKLKAKQNYELNILKILHQNKIDILISDSYTKIFTSLVIGNIGLIKNGDGKNHSNYYQLAFNIHPADTSIYPGITPTADALFVNKLFRRANSSKTVFLNNTKYFKIGLYNQPANYKEDEIKAARRIYLKKEGCFINEEEGNTFLYVPVGLKNSFSAKTGATFHFIDEGIDTGKKIVFSNSTPIRKGDSEQELRNRNYYTKNLVLRTGLILALKNQKTQNLVMQKRRLEGYLLAKILKNQKVLLDL